MNNAKLNAINELLILELESKVIIQSEQITLLNQKIKILTEQLYPNIGPEDMKQSTEKNLPFN